MKKLVNFLFIIALSINALEAQNRIIFKMGNFIECKIKMINTDKLSITTMDEHGKNNTYLVDYKEIDKIQGPLTKSEAALLKRRNPEIVFEESFNPPKTNNEYSDNDYLAIQIKSLDNLVPLEDIQTLYRDGELFKYYSRNGINITMNVFADRAFGKDYVAFISIQNLSGDKFDFMPSEIRAIHMINGGSKNAKVLSTEEYMAIVDRKQTWNSFLVAFGETTSAMNAGYSTTSLGTSVQGNISTNYSGQIGNTSGAYQGTSNTNVNMNVNSQSTTYDRGNQYAANQNARRNIASYDDRQFQIRENLNAGYLKRNTIFNEQNVFGHVNINYEQGKQLVLIVPVNGENFCFPWYSDNEITFK